MLRKLVENNRSYRRFQEDKPISVHILRDLIDLARLTPSARNVQPLRYMLVTKQSEREKVFPSLAWAGNLKDWPGPEAGERPSGYVIILRQKELKDAAGVDHGIVAQTIMLGAVEKGFGGCIIGAINKKQLRQELAIDEQYEILLVLALGVPAEVVVIEDLPASGDTGYWRDEQSVHHVPKRQLDELIISQDD
mgnify:FL=1